MKITDNWFNDVLQLKNVIDIRRSVRTYTGQAVEFEIKEAMEKILISETGPFGQGPKYMLLSQNDSSKDVKLGTYGVIKNAKDYMISVTNPSPDALASVGYTMERAVLEAHARGLGTCWLGGTFNKGRFAEAVGLKEGELLPIVIPFGYPTQKESFIGSTFRAVAGSNKRKPWNELFFDQNTKTGKIESIEANSIGSYAMLLEMVQAAPSASNKQPWRVVRDNEKWHFFLERTKGYGSALGYDIQMVDIGIAVCHFDMGIKAAGIIGAWKKCDPAATPHPDGFEYVISWIDQTSN